MKNIYLNVVNNNWAGKEGGDIHSMTIFLELLNTVHKNDFLNKIFKIISVPSSCFPLLSQFHYPSLLNDIQVWDINIWRTNKDGYKSF